MFYAQNKTIMMEVGLN